MQKDDKVYTTAVIMMPPESSWDSIQKIRFSHDKAYQRWMPHINMLYPFVAEDRFTEILPKLQETLNKFSPFVVTFNEFDFFSHGKNSHTLYLKPDPVSRDILRKIETELVSALPMCDDLAKRSPEGFQPHLTLGQWKSKDVLTKVIEELKRTWIPITFTVTELYMISRTKDDPFVVKDKISVAC